MRGKPLTLYRFRPLEHALCVEPSLTLLRVPAELAEAVLVDSGPVVVDSNAILIYLASVYDPERHCYPADPERAAAVRCWLTTAAVVLQPFTVHAPEGHISLDPYSATRARLQGMESLAGLVAMDRTEPCGGLPEGV